MRTENFIRLLFLLFLMGCDMFESHPYDTKVRGMKNINQTHITQIEESLKDKKSFRFAFISDTQRWYDETQEMVDDINRRKNIDFVIHGGDLSDFGATKEFMMQRDILMDLRMPHVALLGNHDCLGTGEDTFNEIWGNPNYCFKAGNIFFICLNTNCLEYDYSEPVPDFNYLEKLLRNLPQGVERTIVVMHVPPFDREFNNNVVNVFQLYLKEFPNLLFCMNGHAHSYNVDDYYNDGVLYYQTPCAKKRGYLVFSITENGYEHELVEF